MSSQTQPPPIDATITGATIFGTTVNWTAGAPTGYLGHRLFYTATLNGTTLSVDITDRGNVNVDPTPGSTAATTANVHVTLNGTAMPVLSAPIPASPPYTGQPLALGATVTEDGLTVGLEIGAKPTVQTGAPMSYVVADTGGPTDELRWVDNPVFLASPLPTTARMRKSKGGGVAGPLGPEVP